MSVEVEEQKEKNIIKGNSFVTYPFNNNLIIALNWTRALRNLLLV